VRKLAALFVGLTAALVAACAGHYGGSGASDATTYAFPGMPNLTFTAKLPSGSCCYINEELPQDGLGTVHDKYWHNTLGHMSQQQYSQALGFPPNTQVTIQNIDNVPHTLNVVGKIKGPPAKFPPHPQMTTGPSGGGVLQKGYASGIIYPGGSVTVTLGKKGIYLIGCAFHYNAKYYPHMRDVIVVEPSATPGPQGTAPPSR
jgi:hypothetical protein